MTYEVEQKFPVADLAGVESQLAALGAPIAPPQVEIDQYYAHPERDFAATDEALRIRTVGDAHRITYKGPKLDATTKTRREIELALAPGTEAGWEELLAALGFRPVGLARKTRRKAWVAWQGRRVEVSLDEVDRLGSFVELELVTNRADLEPAKACLGALAGHLGLHNSQRRSYLELLLDAAKAPTPSI